MWSVPGREGEGRRRREGDREGGSEGGESVWGWGEEGGGVWSMLP